MKYEDFLLEDDVMEIHLYNTTMCQKSEMLKTIAAKVAVQNLIPKYERTWMEAR